LRILQFRKFYYIATTNIQLFYLAFTLSTMKYLLFFTYVCIFLPLNARAEGELDTLICPDLVIMADSIQCLSVPFEVSTTSGFDEYIWSPSNLFSNTTTNPTLATIDNPEQIKVTAIKYGENLITNGNFNSVFIDFQSDYRSTATNIAEGEFKITNDPNSWNGGLSNCNDHTGNNIGMMVINGAPVLNQKIWEKTVTVKPNTPYQFSLWVQKLHLNNGPIVSISLNGVAIGENISLNGSTCIWTNFYKLWNSASATQAKITIENVNPALDGNDFALDDIFFGEICRKEVTKAIRPFALDSIGVVHRKCSNLGNAIAYHPFLNNRDINYFLNVTTPLATNQAPNLAAGIYAFTANYKACSDTKPFIIRDLRDNIVLDIEDIQENNCSHLGALDFSINGSPNNEIPIINKMTLNGKEITITNPITNLVAGTYKLILESNVSCFDTLDFEIPDERTTIVVDVDHTICNASTPYFFNDHVYTNPGIYFDTLNSVNNCDSVVISHLDHFVKPIYIPNCFTPNEDGINDVFKIGSETPMDINMNIFDKWGNNVFSAKGENIEWNGKFGKSRCHGGVYLYTIAIECNGEKIPQIGTITLIE
jgi:gliding motility-associated-like protein